MKQQLKNKIVSAILAYPPEAMTEAETQAEDIYRAVLKALETPTPAMIEAGVKADFGGTLGSRVTNAFAAMIRAAQRGDDD